MCFSFSIYTPEFCLFRGQKIIRVKEILSYVSHAFGWLFSLSGPNSTCIKGLSSEDRGRCWQIRGAVHLKQLPGGIWAFHSGPELQLWKPTTVPLRGSATHPLKADLLLQHCSWLLRVWLMPHQLLQVRFHLQGTHFFALMLGRRKGKLKILFIWCNYSPTKPIKRPC